MLNSARKTHFVYAIFALAVGGFAIGTNEFAIMGLLDNMERTLGISTSAAGLVIAAYALGVVVGAPLFAVVGARLPRKTLALGLMSFYLVANLASYFFSGDYVALLLTRFLSGLPHGAFFGIAGVIAASLVSPTRRAWAISMVLMGLSVANVVGVPVVTWLGQLLGWQVMFLVVAALAALCLILMLINVPAAPADPGARMRTELGALGHLQVWLTVGIGAIGFGGFFAVYTYVAPTILQVTLLPETILPLVTGLYGLGMVIGNYLGGRLADWSIRKTIYLVLATTIVVLGIYDVLARFAVPALILVFAVGMVGAALVPALQSRLLDSAPKAPSLAASLTHSALNIGNFMGAYLGALVIGWGWGLNAPPLVGMLLALVGLLIAVLSFRLSARNKR